jgi:hypothetical protein
VSTLTRPAAGILALAISLASPLHAQTSSAAEPMLVPGAKVRVKYDRGESYEGRLVSVRRDSLTVAWTKDLVATVASSDIAVLEVGTGARRQVVRGAFLGAGLGVLAGSVAGALLYRPTCNVALGDDCSASNARGDEVGRDAYVGGALGLVFGAAQGLIAREQWRRVPLDRTAARLDLRPLHGGASGVGLAVSF